MPIHINKRQSDYIVIHNSLVPTPDLSPESLGILAHFLTMPKDWNPSIEHLHGQFQIGDFKAKRIFKELQTNHCLYPEKRRKKGRFQSTLWHVSNVPLTNNEFKALIQAADPDHLPDTQPAEAAESENAPSIQHEEPAVTFPEPIPEDNRSDVQEAVTESPDESVEDEATVQPEDSAEKLPESPPEDERKDVQVKVVTESKNETSGDEANSQDSMNVSRFSDHPDDDPEWKQRLKALYNHGDHSNRDGLGQVSNVPPSDDKLEAPMKEADPLPVTQHQEVAESKNEIYEDAAIPHSDDPVGALLEPLPDDEGRDVEDKIVAENENETTESETTPQRKKSSAKQRKKRSKGDKRAEARKKRKKVR